MRRAALFLIFALTLTTLACNLASPQATFAPPPDPSPSGQAVPPAGTDNATATASSPAGADPTPTLFGGAGQAVDLAAVPTTLPDLATWLTQARDADTPLPDVCTALLAARWQTSGNTCQAADLNDDQKEEWLLTIDTSQVSTEPPPVNGHAGDFWLLHDAGLYQQSRAGGEPADTAPTLLALADLTGDDRPEAITVFETCGAHTCIKTYHILSMHRDELQDIARSSTPAGQTDPSTLPSISLATVENEEIRDANDDGIDDLVLRGGVIGSVGAGVQRTRREVWAWDGFLILLADTLYDETNYRHHRLYDANLAFDAQQYDASAGLYEQVVTNTNLEDVPPPTDNSYTALDSRAYTRQFAAFRLTMLPLLRGDITEATRWRNWLQDTFPQAPLAQAAAMVLAEWESNRNDLPAACAAVTNFLAAQPNPTGPLADMGYGNPALAAADVCPLR